MSAPRTEELRQRLLGYVSADDQDAWPVVPPKVLVQVVEALAVLEEQNSTLTRERDELKALLSGGTRGLELWVDAHVDEETEEIVPAHWHLLLSGTRPDWSDDQVVNDWPKGKARLVYWVRGMGIAWDNALMLGLAPVREALLAHRLRVEEKMARLRAREARRPRPGKASLKKRRKKS